jgi:hypothetical protein
MFELSFSINNKSNVISGFDLGHISFFSDNITISSHDRTPDQSMMVFQTIVDLLDGLKEFWKNKKAKDYKIICADSSFTIIFRREKNGKVNIKEGETVISKLDEKFLAKQVYDACNNFFRESKIKMIESDPILEDIEAALQEYKESL